MDSLCSPTLNSDMHRTSRTGCTGQAAIEFVGLLPAIIIVGLVILQAAVLGLTLIFSQVALTDSVRAAHAGRPDPDIRTAATSALPKTWASRVGTRQDGDTLTVRIRVPRLLPLPTKLRTISASESTSSR